MRLWLSGPRLFGIRPGISFSPRIDRGDRSRRREGGGEFVYVVRGDETGRVKIGSSGDPRARVAELQTGSAERLALLYAFQTPEGFAYSVESAAQHIARSKRLHGEWFDMSPAMAVASIYAAADLLNCDLGTGGAPRARVGISNFWRWGILIASLLIAWDLLSH